jgi:hypothetical protein
MTSTILNNNLSSIEQEIDKELYTIDKLIYDAINLTSIENELIDYAKNIINPLIKYKFNLSNSAINYKDLDKQAKRYGWCISKNNRIGRNKNYRPTFCTKGYSRL